jgi:HK97 family phage major capsid protein
MARNVYEKEKLAHEKAIADTIADYEKIIARADEEGRRLTDEENEDIAHSIKKVKTIQAELAEVEESIKHLDEVREIGRQLGPAVPTLDSVRVASEPLDRAFDQMNRQHFQQAQKTLGEQFVSSKGYKSLLDRVQANGGFSGEWTTGQIPLEMKGTLLEGASSPGAGSGGGLLPIPQVVPGVVQTLFQRLSVADLLMDGQTSGNTLRYVVEGTATSGAAGVAEGGLKPESVLGLSTKDEPIKKIATLLPVSEEMLEDAPAVQSYINGRLSLFVRIEEERQLLRGASGGNEVQGILTSRGVPVYAGGTAVGNRAVQAFIAMNGMRGSAFIEPEWLIIHPTDYQAIRLLTDNQGQFFGGGPFQGPYNGQGQMLQASGQVAGGNDSLWGKQVVVTAAIGGAGTALIGTRANAQVWRRGGVSVEASNSHSTYFANNLVAIRAEERLGLAVYRPTGYVELRLS